MTFQNERAEIIAIAEMLTDGEDIYFLLGAARGLLKLEAKKEKAQSAKEEHVMPDERLKLYKQQRKEIRDILRTLTDGEHIYYLLGSAKAMKELEEEAKQKTK